MKFINNHKNIFVGGIILLSISFICLIVVLNTNIEKQNDEISLNTINETTTQTEIITATTNKFYIDIKGAVKKPGVYEVEDGMIVKDAIDLAGGLKDTATTSNINLSQKLTSEMVIYIFTKKELNTTVINTLSDTSCTTNVIDVTTPVSTSSTKDETTSLVNINTASKEELMTLSGVGASKADAIIIYRTDTPFTKIEDIKNVSGIGESAFDKIKNNITV